MVGKRPKINDFGAVMWAAIKTYIYICYICIGVGAPPDSLRTSLGPESTPAGRERDLPAIPNTFRIDQKSKNGQQNKHKIELQSTHDFEGR